MLKPEGASLRPHVERWRKVVAASKATILSSVSSDSVDAYLLSESSLFVYDRSVVMITCGTTSLVSAVEEMLTFISRDEVDLLVFERKNEFFPDAQPSAFDEDVRRIQQYLPGEELVLGSQEGNHVRLFYYSRPEFRPPKNDMTMELLMHHLGQDTRDIFCREGLTRDALYAETKIAQAIDGFKVDDFLFEPQGYSLNAVKGDDYFTFHVTPEQGYSYASFETNYHFGDDLGETVNRVLNIFKPRSFSLVLFDQEQLALPEMAHYTETSRLDTREAGYDIRFRNYREPDNT